MSGSRAPTSKGHFGPPCSSSLPRKVHRTREIDKETACIFTISKAYLFCSTLPPWSCLHEAGVVRTAGPRPAGWPTSLPYLPIYLKDPLAPATDLANPQKPEPNNSPEPRLHAGTTIAILLVPRVGDAKVVEATSCCLPACSFLPSYLTTPGAWAFRPVQTPHS